MAGTQSGKTCFGPEWLLREIRDTAVDKEWNDYLVVTSTYDEFKLKLLPELRLTFEDTYRCGRYWSGSRIMELTKNLLPLGQGGRFLAKNQDDKMWGRVILRSADAKTGLECATAKAAWLDEVGQHEFERDSWEAVIRRLSLAQGRCLGTTTLYEINWLKHEVYDRWVDGDTDYDVIQVDSIVNPRFPVDEYYRAQATLPEWKFNLFYRGRYSKPAGMIYDSFNEAACVIKRSQLPIEYKNWPIYVGHDFGGAHPAAIFYAAEPASGNLFAFREYMAESMSALEQVTELKEICAGENIVKRAGGAPHEDGWREAYTSAKWLIEKPAVKSVEVGIDKVYSLHKQNRLFVVNDLHRYLDEKSSYSRELDDDYEPTEEIRDKKRYHLMDAERYIISCLMPDVFSIGDKSDSGSPRQKSSF